MRLLLTSAGITNKSIEEEFLRLVGKPFGETLVAFVPTASNLVAEDKFWVINDLTMLKKLGCKVDIVDPTALPKENFLTRFEKADVIFVEGGDTFYLMDCIHRFSAFEPLKELLQSKVYVGVSAGSAICSKDLALAAAQKMYDEAPDRKEDVRGLNVIPFYIFPHYGSKEWFPKVTKENASEFLSVYESEIYLIDDMTAISVEEGVIKVISEGSWEKL